jgi:hypothetical protein
LQKGHLIVLSSKRINVLMRGAIHLVCVRACERNQNLKESFRNGSYQDRTEQSSWTCTCATGPDVLKAASFEWIHHVRTRSPHSLSSRSSSSFKLFYMRERKHSVESSRVFTANMQRSCHHLLGLIAIADQYLQDFALCMCERNEAAKQPADNLKD